MNTIFYFKSPSCAPCEALTPIIDGLALEYEDIEFVVLDITAEENAALVENAGIIVLPTLVFVADGGELDRIEGSISSEGIKEAIDLSFYSDQEPDTGSGPDLAPGIQLFETIIWGFAIYGAATFIKNRT